LKGRIHEVPFQNEDSQLDEAIDRNRAVIVSRHISDEEFQEHIPKELEKELAIFNNTVLKEAFDAADETRKALRELEDNDKTAAFKAMEKALGKLDLLLTRYPDASLAPLHATGEIVSLVAEKDDFESNLKPANEQMDLESVQVARDILDNLVSEIRISTVNIPLAVYADALRVFYQICNPKRCKRF